MGRMGIEVGRSRGRNDDFKLGKLESGGKAEVSREATLSTAPRLLLPHLPAPRGRRPQLAHPRRRRTAGRPSPLYPPSGLVISLQFECTRRRCEIHHSARLRERPHPPSPGRPSTSTRNRLFHPNPLCLASPLSHPPESSESNSQHPMKTTTINHRYSDMVCGWIVVISNESAEGERHRRLAIFRIRAGLCPRSPSAPASLPPPILSSDRPFCSLPS